MRPELFLSQFVSQHMYKLAYLNETKFAVLVKEVIEQFTVGGSAECTEVLLNNFIIDYFLTRGLRPF
jgi:hypothetical protein